MNNKQSVNLILPAKSEPVWILYENLLRKVTAGDISQEMQTALINRMKIFNKRMIDSLEILSQKNEKHFSRQQNEKIRENLQNLINVIFFDRAMLELEIEILKKHSFLIERPFYNHHESNK